MSQRPVPLGSDHLQSLWNRLNARFFRSALPPIDIAWSWRLTASAGMFVSREGPRVRPRTGRPLPGRRLIRLSVPLLQGQSQDELVRTLAHEMIHQWQYDVLKRRPNHGPDFHRMKRILNQAGHGVTVRHTLDTAVLSLSRYAWQCLRCGIGYHRHRKTIRPSVHRCGGCRGRLREVTAGVPQRTNGTRADSARSRPAVPVAGQLTLPY